MLIQKKKRVICIGMMLVLTAFVGMSTNASAENLPPVANTGGPYIADEAGIIFFDGSNSYDPNGDPLLYNWTINEIWTGWSSDWHAEYTWLDDYTGYIILNVTDGLLYDTCTTTVTVSNMVPEFKSVDGPSQVFVGEQVLLLIEFFDGDPRSEGSADSYSAVVDWNDGYFTSRSLAPLEFLFTETHVYNVVITEPTIFNVQITITDDNGGQASATFPILVLPIGWIDVGPDVIMNEGTTYASWGIFARTSSLAYTAEVNYADNPEYQELLLNANDTFYLNHQYCDNGDYTVFVILYENEMWWGEDTAIVTVLNVPPTIESFTSSPTEPIPLGAPMSVVCSFSDPGCLDNHSAIVDWGDGNFSTMADIPVGIYTISLNHTYGQVGVYDVSIVVYDKDHDSDSADLEYWVVVYDASAGFVTGGGWINSPAGAYFPDPSLSGKATFGFVSKYKRGQTHPDGNTEFQFHASSMNFHSHTYLWLIIAGSTAMYKGIGTINGAGNYGFILFAEDGQKSGSGVDTFRIKIWDIDNNYLDVYDNDPGTALSGGQITIHKA